MQPKRLGRAIGPLMKVVEELRSDNGARKQKLECGHTLHHSQDLYGYTNTERRRCWKCRKEAEMTIDLHGYDTSTHESRPTVGLIMQVEEILLTFEEHILENIRSPTQKLDLLSFELETVKATALLRINQEMTGIKEELIEVNKNLYRLGDILGFIGKGEK